MPAVDLLIVTRWAPNSVAWRRHICAKERGGVDTLFRDYILPFQPFDHGCFRPFLESIRNDDIILGGLTV